MNYECELMDVLKSNHCYRRHC